MDIKPVDFKLSQYLSDAYELYKNNFGKILVGAIFVILLSLIPFCGFLAQGNFYKFLSRLKAGENPDPSEIFNFDNFKPYFFLFLILFAGVLILEMPLFAIIFLSQNKPDEYPVYFPVYMVILMAVIFYIACRAFYMLGLISLKGINDLKEAWRISSEMSKGNLLIIFAFSIVASLCAQVGFLACGIGVLLTLPFQYVATFFAMDDGLKQQRF